jgi:ubiquinone/menaquinone biosynthesis C-methylase UbiE
MAVAKKLKPDWAGKDLLSRFVNLLIQTKPVYKLMKSQARQVLIKTAEKNGIAWRTKYQELENSGVKELLAEINNKTIIYPDYYQVPFHAYDRGNMCWEAAFEAESATQAMALRVWRDEKLTWEEAQEKLRSSFYSIVDRYSANLVTDILDMGCSVGISTLSLHRHYARKQKQPIRTVGLDLSPYMLSVAKIADEKQEISEWIHSLAEDTGLLDNSFDLITLQFVIHELPRYATKQIFQEALRLLRKGGILAIVDNNPASPTIQNLPPALFVLMKSTEPWSDDYYTFDIESALQEVGFQHETTVASDPRHRTIIARK